MSDTTQPSLIYRLRDHDDSQAWESFCDIYGPLILRFTLSRGIDENDAADVAQEVLLRVAKAIRGFQYDRSRGRFRDWLRRLVQNEIARWYSQRPTTRPLEDIEQLAIDAAEQWNHQFEERVLAVALARIRPRFNESTWQAFELVWCQNQNALAVAEQLNRSLDFVYVAKSRVLKRLRLEIEQLAEDANI